MTPHALRPSVANRPKAAVLPLTGNSVCGDGQNVRIRKQVERDFLANLYGLVSASYVYFGVWVVGIVPVRH